MRNLHGTAKRIRFLTGLTAAWQGRMAVLVVTAVLLVLASAAQGQETPATPQDRATLITAADNALEAGRFTEAVRVYSQAEKTFGGDGKLFRSRGIAREMLGEDRKAVEDFKLAIKADEGDYESMEHLSGIYERAGTHIPDAITFYKRALELDPRPKWKDDLTAWIAMLQSRLRPDDATAVGCWHLGNERMQKHDYAGAESWYSRAIDLNPQFFQAYFSRGLLHLKAGEAATALADFEQTVKLVPDLAQAFLQRGLAREQLGNLKQAREDFARAAKMDPRDPAALYHYARTLESDDDHETALKLYRDALRFRPTPDLMAAIREKMSGLASSPRARRARSSDNSSETKSMW